MILNNLYKHTQLQDTFGIIMLAIVDQRPRVLNLLEACELFIDFRRDVVRRRTAFELRKAEARAHILEGFVIALDHLDEVIALIRGAKTPAEAQRRADRRASGSPRSRPTRSSSCSCSGSPASSARRSWTSSRRSSVLIADLEDILAKPKRVDADRGRGAHEDPRGPRRPAPHRDRRRRRRDHRRGHDRRRGRGDLHHPRRLHQAHLDRDLPLPAARRPRARRA